MIYVLYRTDIMIDIMEKNNGLCKGNCIQFKAKRPTFGNRYASGQVRCQVCEIYLIPEGVNENRFCKCCNFRVRTKPRNSAMKEKYHEAVRKAKAHWISIDENGDIDESTKENRVDDFENEKKSTPIYEEIDESVKTYYEFKEFLKSKIKPQANYQVVMLKELLEYGKLHKGEISESLAYFNNKNTLDIDAVKYYFDVPVYDVLLNHGFVIEVEGFYDLPNYSLNVKLEDFQKIELIDYLTNAIAQYNKEHNIPENEFPNSNNMENIDWHSYNFKSKSKVQKIKNFVKKINPTSTQSFWIWPVTPKNWEIVKSKNVWGSKFIQSNIAVRMKSGDQVAFYVIGTQDITGIFELVGDWYDSPGKTWNDDLQPDGSLMYVSQIQIKPIQLGSVKIHTLHEKLDVFINSNWNNKRNLIVQGKKWIRINHSKPLSEGDFTIIRTELMRNQEQNKTTQNEPEAFSDTHEPWIDVNEDYQNISDNVSNEKKSAPVYEEIDESVKTFYELKDFLDTINLQDNYQLVMLKELIEYGENHKGEIAESLAYFNNKDTTDIDEVKYYFTVPVYDVLMNHGFVITTGYKRWRYLIYKLNVDLNESQKSGILEIIENKLNEYNKLHEIPGNEFPNSNNRGSINWNSRKCSETFPQIFLGNGHTEFNQVEHDIFKKYTDTPLFKKCTDIIKKDQILTNDEIISTFKVGNMGGIRYTKENDVIVLLSTYSNDYDDSIDTDSGLIIYTGEGKGDQELKNGNEKILNSQNTPMVFFKEAYQEKGARPRGALDNKYKFIGVVKYQKHYWKEEKGRQVVKFVLEIQS